MNAARGQPSFTQKNQHITPLHQSVFTHPITQIIMKRLPFLVWLLALSAPAFAQTTYYQSPQGNILDSAAYQAKLQTTVEQMEKIKKPVRVNEVFEELRRTDDSVVVSYFWEFAIGKETPASLKDQKARTGLVGQRFPFENLENQALVQNLGGKPSLINMWFTSCPPCVEEMPALNALKAELGEQVNFLAITFESPKKVEQFLQKREFDFLQLAGERAFLKKLGISAYPVNIFLDRNGIVQQVEGGLPYEKGEDGKLRIGSADPFRDLLNRLLLASLEVSQSAPADNK
jgi:thiol-disulfide isomerase/thioredoxin